MVARRGRERSACGGMFLLQPIRGLPLLGPMDRQWAKAARCDPAGHARIIATRDAALIPICSALQR